MSQKGGYGFLRFFGGWNNYWGITLLSICTGLAERTRKFGGNGYLLADGSVGVSGRLAIYEGITYQYIRGRMMLIYSCKGMRVCLFTTIKKKLLKQKKDIGCNVLRPYWKKYNH